MNTTTTISASRRSVMSVDDATQAIVTAIHHTVDALPHHHTDIIDDLLHGRRQPGNDLEVAVIATWRRRVTRIRTHGHAGLIDDQIEGYLSALNTDPAFHPAA